MKELFTESIQFGCCDLFQTSKKLKPNKNHEKVNVKYLYEYKESIKPSLGGSTAMDQILRDVTCKTLMLKTDVIQTKRESGSEKAKWERFFPPAAEPSGLETKGLRGCILLWLPTLVDVFIKKCTIQILTEVTCVL